MAKIEFNIGVWHLKIAPTWCVTHNYNTSTLEAKEGESRV
jgi:hypothetical protein